MSALTSSSISRRTSASDKFCESTTQAAERARVHAPTCSRPPPAAISSNRTARRSRRPRSTSSASPGIAELPGLGGLALVLDGVLDPPARGVEAARRGKAPHQLLLGGQHAVVVVETVVAVGDVAERGLGERIAGPVGRRRRRMIGHLARLADE